MKTIIIDDEPSAIKVLADKLGKHDEIEVIGTAVNGISGVLMVKEKKPDLLFLDIELPDMSGLELLRQIDSITTDGCKVVIYSAHSKYILPAFREKAFDFLQKPIDDSELKKILERCRQATDNKTDTTNSISDADNARLLLYTNATDFRMVNIEDICVFQYNHDLRLWEVVAADRETPIRLKRTANNEALLGIDKRFVQVSQKFIINIDYLMEVNNNVCRFFPPFDNIDYVSIGRVYRKQLIEKFKTF